MVLPPRGAGAARQPRRACGAVRLGGAAGGVRSAGGGGGAHAAQRSGRAVRLGGAKAGARRGRDCRLGSGPAACVGGLRELYGCCTGPSCSIQVFRCSCRTSTAQVAFPFVFYVLSDLVSLELHFLP